LAKAGGFVLVLQKNLYFITTTPGAVQCYPRLLLASSEGGHQKPALRTADYWLLKRPLA
jgi:hypothetical protein